MSMRIVLLQIMSDEPCFDMGLLLQWMDDMILLYLFIAMHNCHRHLTLL